VLVGPTVNGLSSFALRPLGGQRRPLVCRISLACMIRWYVIVICCFVVGVLFTFVCLFSVCADVVSHVVLGLLQLAPSL
jgi:hypothetical protein